MLSFGFSAFEVKTIIGRDQGQFHFFCKFNQHSVQLLLPFEAIILEFKVETSIKQITIPACQFSGLFLPALEQGLGDQAFKTAAEGNQPMVILFKGGLINTGYALLFPFRKGVMGKVGQAPVSFSIEADQLSLGRSPRSTETSVFLLCLRRKNSHPDQRFEARLFHGMIEFHGPVHVSVIGDRTGIKTLLLKGGGQLRDLDRAFKQRVLGMEVKVGEHGQ